MPEQGGFANLFIISGTAFKMESLIATITFQETIFVCFLKAY